LVPFLDGKSKANQRSRLFFWFGVFVVAFIIVMTILGYIVE
jgi:quinol-cytochrome oxidoreductase complex cytochrome b subunit